MFAFINLLTISRILLSVLIFLLIATKAYWLSLFFFLIASVTDYFDGYLARKYKLESTFGEILDPIADKMLVVFILFGLATSINSFYFSFAASLIIVRELWVAALRDFNSRNNKSSLTKVLFIGKFKTFFQLSTINLYLFGLAINNNLIILIADILLMLTCLITVYSGYIYTHNTFKKNL